MAQDLLAGRCVLVVEDDLLIGLMIGDFLDDVQSVVLGPFDTVGDALFVARTTPIDIAILDVALGDERVYPVAEVLSGRGIPFLLVTAFGADGVPEGKPWPWMTKPFSGPALLDRMREMLAQRRVSDEEHHHGWRADKHD